jgi:type 1 glutamine amidotransferase
MLRGLLRAALGCAVAAIVVLGSESSVGQDAKMIEKVTAALPDKAPAVPKAKRKILIYSRTGGFRHGSIAIGAKAIAMMGDKTGAYLAEHTEDPSYFAPEKLKVFDAVFMMNTTGNCLYALVDENGQIIPGAREDSVEQKLVPVDAKGKAIEGAKVEKINGKDTVVDAAGKPIPDAKVNKVGGRRTIVNAKGEELPNAKKIQEDSKNREEFLKKSLAEFVASGKGLAGVHSATDTYGGWKEYNKMMGGAFAGHPWTKKVPVKNLEPKHPLNAAFDGKDFEVTDEIYQFRLDTALPSERKFLLALDTEKMDPKDVQAGNRNKVGGLYPVSWCATYEKGRTFYCSLGHMESIYWNPVVLRHYLAGIQYALGDLEADATPTEKSTK